MPLPVQDLGPDVAPLVPAVEDWLLAGLAAPRLHVEPVTSVMAALTPGNGTSDSSMAAADGTQAGASHASIGFTAVDVNTAASPLPSPTPATPSPSPTLS